MEMEKVSLHTRQQTVILACVESNVVICKLPVTSNTACHWNVLLLSKKRWRAVAAKDVRQDGVPFCFIFIDQLPQVLSIVLEFPCDSEQQN